MAQDFAGYEIAVISDVHLRNVDDQRYVLLCEVIARLREARIPHIVLLGDIFDFYYAWPRYFRKKYIRLIEALERIAKDGLKPYFYEGNHEFSLHLLRDCPGVQVVRDGSISIALKNGKKVILEHGDLVYCKEEYRWFRGFLKSNIIAFLAAMLPGRCLECYALWHAKTSRAQDKYRTIDHARLLAAADLWIQKQNADVGVIGHFHVPYHEKLGEGRTLLSVDSWDKPNVLLISSDRISRAFWDEQAARWDISPA